MICEVGRGVQLRIGDRPVVWKLRQFGLDALARQAFEDVGETAELFLVEVIRRD